MHQQKCYQCKIKIECKNTLTTREHGLGELLDQECSLLLVLVVRVGHVVKTRVLTEEHCDLPVLFICERLWEFRPCCFFISTVLTWHLTWRRFITSTSPGRLGLFSPCCFTWFPALALLLLSLAHCYNSINLTPIVVFTLRSVRLLSSSTRVLLYLYCCEGSRVLIVRFPRDHPLQSRDHRMAPHGWSHGNRWMTARRGPFIGTAGSPFDDTGIILRSSDGDCRISVRSPADFYCYISDGGPWIAARGSDGVPRAAAGWGKVWRHPADVRQILTAS